MQTLHGRETGTETGRKIGREIGRRIGRQTGKVPGMNILLLPLPVGKKRRRDETLEVCCHDPLKSVQYEIRGIEEVRAALQRREKKASASVQRASVLQTKLDVILL